MSRLANRVLLWSVAILTALAGAAALSLAQEEKPASLGGSRQANKEPATQGGDGKQPAGVTGQQQPDARNGAAVKNPQEMEAAMKAMMPGPIHARLNKLAGDWETLTRVEVAGQPPSETRGTATIKSALEGRFLHETGSGEMMGMPAQHFKMWGYNNGSKRFEATWTWTLSTGFLHMEGETRDDARTINWKAWFDNETGLREEFKALTTITDDDHFSTRIYGGKMPDGSPAPTMNITYTRHKQNP